MDVRFDSYNSAFRRHATILIFLRVLSSYDLLFYSFIFRSVKSFKVTLGKAATSITQYFRNNAKINQKYLPISTSCPHINNKRPKISRAAPLLAWSLVLYDKGEFIGLDRFSLLYHTPVLHKAVEIIFSNSCCLVLFIVEIYVHSSSLPHTQMQHPVIHQKSVAMEDSLHQYNLRSARCFGNWLHLFSHDL
jgi:hypothetical protein